MAAVLGVGVNWLQHGDEAAHPALNLVADVDSAVREEAEHYRAIPYMADTASAGSGRIMEDEVEGHIVIHERVAPVPDHLRGIRLTGDSMAPTLPDGSIVGVDITQRDPAQLEGEIVCCRVEDEEQIVVKRLRRGGKSLILCSDNPDQDEYPPVLVDLEDHPDAIIGRVVWAWQDFSK